jgi:hypothetical protein
VAAFRLLVLLGRKQEALGLTELLTDRSKKVRVLQCIAEQLRQQANDGSEWFELFMRAGDVAHTIQDSFQQARALRVLGTAMGSAGKFKQLLHVIQREWRQVEKREEALTLFSIASAFFPTNLRLALLFLMHLLGLIHSWVGDPSSVRLGEQHEASSCCQ